MKYQDQVELFNYYVDPENVGPIIELRCFQKISGALMYDLETYPPEACTADSTIDDAIPPIGPYFAECLRYWGANPADCWDK